VDAASAAYWLANAHYQLSNVVEARAIGHQVLAEVRAGLAVEAWYDTLAVYREGPEGRYTPETGGILGGRYSGVLDPEGDYRTLAELPGVVVFGGKGEQALPTPEEMDQLLRQPRTSLVLDLSAMGLAEKVTYATKVLAVVATVRSATGLPHWLVIDEAHHVLPAESSPAADLVRPGAEGLAMITLDAAELAVSLRRRRAEHLESLRDALPRSLPMLFVPELFARTSGMRATSQVAEALSEEL